MLERPFLAAFLCGWFALAVGQPGAPADLRKPAPEPPMRAEEKARRAEEEAASAKRRAERARQEAERAFAQAKRERVQRSAKDVYAEGLALEREGRPVHAWIRYHEAGGYGNARAAARLAEIYEAGTALDLEREAARGGDSAAERRLQTLQKEDPAGLAQVYAAESRKWRDAASVFGAGAAKDGSGQVLPRLFAVAQALEAEGHREALDAYREAVRLGSGKSAKRLFHIYSRGTAEVPLDRGEAAKWQHAARALGEDTADRVTLAPLTRRDREEMRERMAESRARQAAIEAAAEKAERDAKAAGKSPAEVEAAAAEARRAAGSDMARRWAERMWAPGRVREMAQKRGAAIKLYEDAREHETRGRNAAAWIGYRDAARLGSGEAARRKAELYESGLRGVTGPKPEEAAKWRETARALGGGDAAERVALQTELYTEAERLERLGAGLEAVDAYIAAAKAGNATAAKRLAELYEAGIPGMARDRRLAGEWRAAHAALEQTLAAR